MRVDVLLMVHCISLGAVCGGKLLQTSETLVFSRAVIDVINKSFLRDVSVINLITAPSDDDGIKRMMDAIASEVLHNISTSSSSSIRVGDLDNIHDFKEKRFYNVMLISDYKSFEKLNRGIQSERFDFQGFFLVVMVQKYENQYRDMDMIFRSMWQNFIINVNILIRVHDEELEMFSYLPFSPFYCSKAFPVRTNRFINSSFVRSRSYYDDKLKNLHKCPLKVVAFSIPPLMFVGPEGEDGKFQLSGIDGELLKGKLSSSNPLTLCCL